MIRPGKKAPEPRSLKRTLGCGLLFSLLLPLLAFATLYVFGIPATFAAHLLNRFLPEGWTGDCGHVTYRFGRGFVLDSPRIWGPRDRVTPLFRANELALRVSRNAGKWSARLAVQDGHVDTDLGLWADDLRTSQPVRVESLSFKVEADADKLRVEHATFRLAGLRFQLEGTLPLVSRTGQEGSATDRSLQRTGSRLAAELAPHLALAERFQFDHSPEVWIRFTDTGWEADPFRVHLTLSHRGKSNLRGASLAHIQADLSLGLRRLELNQLLLEDEKGRCLWVEGWADLSAETAYAHVRNTLPRYALEAVSPVSITRIFQRISLRIEGESDFDLRFGPSTWDAFGDSIKGQVRATDVFYRDAAFPNVQLSLSYHAQRLRLDPIRAEVGQGSSRGPVEGWLDVDVHTEAVALEAKGQFKPEAVVSLVGPKAERFIREWEFPHAAPSFTVKLSHAGGDAPVLLELNASATDVLSRGALFPEVELQLVLTENQIRIEDLFVARGSEMLEGRIIADAEFEKLDLTIASSLHIHDIAPILGPQVENFLRPYRVRGSNWIELSGRLDLSESQQHHLRGAANFNDLVWEWVNFDNLSSPFTLIGQRLDLPQIRGTLSGGTLEAEARFDDLFEGSGSFTLQLDVRNADLFKVITAATDTTDTPYTGRLTLQTRLEGALRGEREEDVPTETWRGEGSVRIEGGTLFRIPLLLGLSRILSRVVRGFGYASQTDFSADFTIGNNEVRSSNLFLSGRLLSITGEGRYRFDGTIAANVRVHLLNQGFLSDALRFILWPIRKLIEIRLTGTLAAPDWQPRNLPKELFGK